MVDLGIAYICLFVIGISQNIVKTSLTKTEMFTMIYIPQICNISLNEIAFLTHLNFPSHHRNNITDDVLSKNDLLFYI